MTRRAPAATQVVDACEGGSGRPTAIGDPLRHESRNAERVPGRVDHDSPLIGVGLSIGPGSSASHDPCLFGVEVGDSQVKMQLLGHCTLRPCWRLVVVDLLESKKYSSATEDHEIGGGKHDLQIQHRSVKLAERGRIGAINGYRTQPGVPHPLILSPSSHDVKLPCCILPHRRH